MCRRRRARTGTTAKPKGKKLHAEWDAHFAEYKRAYPEPAAEFERVMKRRAGGGMGEDDSDLPGGPTSRWRRATRGSR